MVCITNNIYGSIILHKYLSEKNFIQFTHGRGSLNSLNLKSYTGKRKNLSKSFTEVIHMKMNKYKGKNRYVFLQTTHLHSHAWTKINAIILNTRNMNYDHDDALG